ncbi:hypothetical protein OG21DRAFT_1603182 [Imleria badia]|nr:hypothetical protein OG21DRAFT_1603182 [Imleria badia]
MSQHLLGTGGLLFAVVAIVSVAGYFYHGRGSANSAQKTNTWASLSGLLSSLRHWGTAATSMEAATDWPVDLEVGFEQHVSMVYGRFFHPTFWNLVECHPATPFAPAIYVEDEANEIPVSDPKPPGMNSFLDMNDGDGDDSTNNAGEKPDKDGRPRVKELPPYDTSSPRNVNFSSEIIGTTVRPGAFLSVPGELEDCSSESSSDCEVDYPCSPSDGIATPDSEVDFPCSPYDGIATTDSEFDFSCALSEGILTLQPRSFSSIRRHGVADMAYFAQNLKDSIPEEGYNLVPTISHRAGLFDLSKFAETDPTLSWGPLEQLGAVDDEPMISNCDIRAQDRRDGSEDRSRDVDPTAAPHSLLSVPGELEDDLSESLPSDSEVDFPCSPYDGIATTDSALDFSCSPYDVPTSSNCDIGVHARRDGSGDGSSDVSPDAAPHGAFLCVLKELEDDFSKNLPSDSEADFPCFPYDGIATTESALDVSCLPYDKPTIPHCDISVHDSRDGSGDSSSDLDTGHDLMRRLLAELRDPNLDCKPRPLSEDSDSQYSADDDKEEASVPRLASTSALHHARRNSLESTSTPGTDSDVSDEGPIYPSTPPSKPNPVLARAPDVHMDRMSPRSWDSPPSFPTKAYVRSHRDGRHYGPRVPLLSLPRL